MNNKETSNNSLIANAFRLDYKDDNFLIDFAYCEKDDVKLITNVLLTKNIFCEFIISCLTKAIEYEEKNNVDIGFAIFHENKKDDNKKNSK